MKDVWNGFGFAFFRMVAGVVRIVGGNNEK